MPQRLLFAAQFLLKSSNQIDSSRRIDNRSVLRILLDHAIN